MTSDPQPANTLPTSPSPAVNPPEPATATYVASVPAEVPEKHPGRIEGIIGLLLAVVSLLFFPPILGTLGILLGIAAKKKGEQTLGTVTITLAAVFMVIGMILGMIMYSLNSSEAASGMLIPLLF